MTDDNERRVLALMADGQERTIRMMEDAILGPPADPFTIEVNRLALCLAAYRLGAEGRLAKRKDGEGRVFYRWSQ